MEENQLINKDRPVYISFVAEDREKVKALYNELTAKHIKVEWMYHNLPGNEIVDFERQIGFGEFVILVFGKNYFESWDCMYEFTLVSKYSKLNSKKKIFCVRFDEHDDFKNGNYLDSITKFWQDRKKEGTVFHDRRDLAKYYDYYLNSIPLLRHKYNDFVYLKDNYDSVVKAVQDFFAQNPTPITNSSEIFYKFDKDMWKSFILKTKIDGYNTYFIPDISEGLKNEDDKTLFNNMIKELVSKQVIQTNSDYSMPFRKGKEYFLDFKNNVALSINMFQTGNYQMSYYRMNDIKREEYDNWKPSNLEEILSLPYANVFKNILNGKGEVTINY